MRLLVSGEPSESRRALSQRLTQLFVETSPVVTRLALARVFEVTSISSEGDRKGRPHMQPSMGFSSIVGATLVAIPYGGQMSRSIPL